jgi:hypothetical protein
LPAGQPALRAELRRKHPPSDLGGKQAGRRFDPQAATRHNRAAVGYFANPGQNAIAAPAGHPLRSDVASISMLRPLILDQIIHPILADLAMDWTRQRL